MSAICLAAGMTGWEFEPQTMTLDLRSATDGELLAALRDCQGCMRWEYPERHSEAAQARANEIRLELERRPQI